MANKWTFTDIDRQEAEPLARFLPGRLYDIHAHCYRVQDLHLTGADSWSDGPSDVSVSLWHTHLSRYMGTGGSSLTGGLFFPAPVRTADLDRENDYLAEQLRSHPASRGLLCVSPGYPQESVAAYLAQPQMAGFKPYYVFSDETPVQQASVPSFCPEWIWEMAHDRRKIIMLHIMKDGAIADPDNRRHIREMCLKYPRARLILAHAARSFHAPHARQGLGALQDLDNVWFDTSAVCEPEALYEVLQRFGAGRLLWGSDFPMSEIRGKCVTVGSGFVWLDNDSIEWERHPYCRPTLIGIESLRALQTACRYADLNKDEIEAVFCRNAMSLLGVGDD
ncbi:MAG: amidohydrolase family protein [Paenibacillaceae bacterium]|nr:amidohydrolase family protein [Paenibacillaceae bacterium]